MFEPEHEPDFSDAVNLRVDVQREVIALPTKQRIAVLKWMRDEPLTYAEHDALYRAKKRLRKTLK